MPKHKHKRRRFESESREELIGFAADVFVKVSPSVAQLLLSVAGAYCLVESRVVSGGLAASAVIGTLLRGGRSSDP
jgi:hypothetical protein